ncbi:MAG TPA: hypothetical protein PKA10_19870 [Selenomonadales bacterium]|nr:hypothetical protein [Selenomonadales bacterium]
MSDKVSVQELFQALLKVYEDEIIVYQQLARSIGDAAADQRCSSAGGAIRTKKSRQRRKPAARKKDKDHP